MDEGFLCLGIWMSYFDGGPCKVWKGSREEGEDSHKGHKELHKGKEENGRRMRQIFMMRYDFS